MKLIATLRNFFNSNLLKNNSGDRNGSTARGAAPEQNAQATNRQPIEVMHMAGSRSPRPSRVRRRRHFGRNA